MTGMEKEYFTEMPDQETEAKTEAELTDEIVEMVGNVYKQVNDALESGVRSIGASMSDLAKVVADFTRLYTLNMEKVFCNNWRRFHGIPMIKRKREHRKRWKNDREGI